VKALSLSISTAKKKKKLNILGIRGQEGSKDVKKRRDLFDTYFALNTMLVTLCLKLIILFVFH
jgi:hypothetical protein